jgi:hypothetical protein
MRYVIIRNTDHGSVAFEKSSQAWAAIFHNMIYEQGVIVLPKDFELVSIVEDDEDVKIAMNGNVIGIE